MDRFEERSTSWLPFGSHDAEGRQMRWKWCGLEVQLEVPPALVREARGELRQAARCESQVLLGQLVSGQLQIVDQRALLHVLITPFLRRIRQRVPRQRPLPR